MVRAALVLSLLLSAAAFAAEPPGAALFRQKACIGCHGADGSGNTTVGKSVNARDLRSEEVQKRTDAELGATIVNGRGKMPSFKSSLNAAQVRQVVAYIRILGKKPAE